MAALTDALPLGPLTDSTKLTQEDRLIYELGRDDYPLLSFLPNGGMVGDYLFKFAERALPTLNGVVKAVTDGTTIIGQNNDPAEFAVLNDLYLFEVGDIVGVYSAADAAEEQMIITALNANHDIAVTRAARGTTALTGIAAGDAVYLTGKNSSLATSTVSEGRSQKRAYVTGYVQRIREGVTMLLSEKGIAQPLGKNAADSWADEKNQGLFRWKDRMELSLISGVATVASGAEGYQTAGLLSRITAALGSTVTALDAAGQLSQSKFDDFLGTLLGKYSPKNELWALGGRKVFEAGPTWIAAKQIVQGQNLTGTFGATNVPYQSVNGPKVRFIYEPKLNIFATDSLILLNPNYCHIKNGPNGSRIPKFLDAAQEFADRKAGFWVGECGLQLEVPAGHGIITGVVRAV